MRPCFGARQSALTRHKPRFVLCSTECQPDTIGGATGDWQAARWVMLHVQSSPLPICTRPRVLLKRKRT
jgi:hypothetical protein